MSLSVVMVEHRFEDMSSWARLSNGLDVKITASDLLRSRLPRYEIDLSPAGVVYRPLNDCDRAEILLGIRQ